MLYKSWIFLDEGQVWVTDGRCGEGTPMPTLFGKFPHNCSSCDRSDDFDEIRRLAIATSEEHFSTLYVLVKLPGQSSYVISERIGHREYDCFYLIGNRPHFTINL